MLLSIWFTCLSIASAAPYAHHNTHQNRVLHRRGPLLHEDMLQLYHTEVPKSTETTSTAAMAAAATGWTIAAAPRKTVMYSHSSDTNGTTTSGNTTTDSDDDDDQVNDNNDEVSDTEAAQDDDEVNDNNDEVDEVVAVLHPKASVPSWAIALTTVLLATSLVGLAAFLFLRYRGSFGGDSTDEKATKSSKPEAEDALASYKAFWELKRQSAGSFISADATPAALASDHLANSLARPLSHTSTTTLPRYEQQDARIITSSRSGSPTSEQAPPRGFLYQ